MFGGGDGEAGHWTCVVLAGTHERRHGVCALEAHEVAHASYGRRLDRRHATEAKVVELELQPRERAAGLLEIASNGDLPRARVCGDGYRVPDLDEDGLRSELTRGGTSNQFVSQGRCGSVFSTVKSTVSMRDRPFKDFSTILDGDKRALGDRTDADRQPSAMERGNSHPP